MGLLQTTRLGFGVPGLGGLGNQGLGFRRFEYLGFGV